VPLVQEARTVAPYRICQDLISGQLVAYGTNRRSRRSNFGERQERTKLTGCENSADSLVFGRIAATCLPRWLYQAITGLFSAVYLSVRCCATSA
jgi:hypothetical protein